MHTDTEPQAALNWNSRQLTKGWQRGVNAFFWGLGFTEADFEKAQVGIGVPLLDGNICNVHSHELAKALQAGCEGVGMKAFPFGVPGVSDNITQGMEGGNASLPSRNVIANSTEMVASAHCYDAVIGLHHCDKNGPGFAMALARLNYPGLVVSGGSILPGCHEGKAVTILDAYDAQAASAMGRMSYAESEKIIRVACPGPGGCGIAASFNTWGIVLEAIGLMLPNSSSNPAKDASKKQESVNVGLAIKRLLELNLRPRDILTRPAFINAMTAMAAIGGSTNGVLHILALAREAGVDFTLKDVQAICRKTPVLCNFAPRGKGTMVDLHRLGGTSMLLKHLWMGGLLDDSVWTVAGRRLGEVLFDAPDLPPHQDLIASHDRPFKAYADMQICFGNLAPDGIVFKVSNNQPPRFSGEAICFNDSRSVQEAAAARRIRPGHVVVLRGLGPVASGMPEVLVATAALSVPELDGKVALVSDTRVSGVSHGAIGVHCAPEAAVGGPIGLVEDGDRIEFDLLAGSIQWHVDSRTQMERLSRQKLTPPTHQRVYLADFAATVRQANEGCVSKVVC
jgi:dihydroxy-acid dehydratase